MYIHTNRPCNRTADSGCYSYGSGFGMCRIAGYVYRIGRHFIHLAARQLPRQHINRNTAFKQYVHSYRCECRLQQYSHRGCNSSTHAYGYGHRIIGICLPWRNSYAYGIGCKLVYLAAG